MPRFQTASGSAEPEVLHELGLLDDLNTNIDIKHLLMTSNTLLTNGMKIISFPSFNGLAGNIYD